MAVQLWRVQKGSKLLGPFPLEQLQQLIQAGMVGATDPVNHEPGNVWKPAGEYHELFPQWPSLFPMIIILSHVTLVEAQSLIGLEHARIVVAINLIFSI